MSVLRNDASVLVYRKGVPVVVERPYGMGRVVWSGLNIGVHSQIYENRDERIFFANIIDDLFRFEEKTQPAVEISTSEPGRYKIIIHGYANGILLAGESTEGWSALIEGKPTASLQVVDYPKTGLYILTPNKEWKSLDVEFIYTGKQSLQFYELKSEYTSPILHPSNASVIGVAADAYSYETFLRTIGMYNVNSKKLIPLRISEPIDTMELDELNRFDALVLYGYKYKNFDRAWQLLDTWVNGGGKLFIETGSMVPESDTYNLHYEQSALPDLFPMKQTQQKELGEQWVLSVGNEDFFKGVDIDKFGQPILDGAAWKFSVPTQDSLKDGVEVILKQQNQPLIARLNYGKGEVIWSGMNLPYHSMVYKNADEGLLFYNILDHFIKFAEQPIPQDYAVERPNPQEARISLKPARGVMFREQAYGWKATLTNPYKRQLKVYKTGPTYYGFNYVFLPDGIDGEAKVSFKFGSWTSATNYAVLSMATILFIVDYVFLDGLILTRRMRPWFKRSHKKVRKWWEKEDEY
jgi:hypothetical protein